MNYSEGGECRHGEILTYYKDSQRIENCGHCDNCVPRSDRKIRLSPLSAIKVDRAVAAVKVIVKKQATKKRQLELDADLNDIQQKRYDKLRSWRKERAKQLDVPAFVIFSDQTLKHLAIRNPQTIDQVRDVYGFGEAKLEKFGWDVLEVLDYFE